MARPSIFGSVVSAKSSRSARSAARRSQSASSASDVALERLSSGSRCSTDEKASSGAAPVRCVGESGVISSGQAASRARSSANSSSYSPSLTSGASST